MSQLDVPARPLGHSTTQLEPLAQVVWHGGVAQAKSHALAAKQVQVPFAHTPAHARFGSPVKEQWLPLPQAQVPFAQAPVDAGLSPSQVVWQGGASQVKRQLAPAPQT